MDKQLSMRGAVDLAALAAQRDAQRKAAQRAQQAAAAAASGTPAQGGSGPGSPGPGSPGPGPSGAAAVVVDVTEATFQAEVLERSMQVPVVVDLWATWCEPCKALSPVLERLAAEYGGRFVLAKVDVDAEQRIAAAFQVQSIPSVLAVLRGQPVPLFTGALPEAQVRRYLDELLAVAARNGVTGTAGGPAAPAQEPGEPAVDPRYQAAYEAVEHADWDAAEAAYRALLADDPKDPDAAAGLALVGVYRRTDGVEPAAALRAAAGDQDAQLLAADVQLLDGDSAGAFARLVELVRRTSGDERDTVRRRLLELFDVAGPDDPAVPPARLALANALF